MPLVLLGIRTAYKEELQSSAAELIYSKPLRIPGEFLVPDLKVEPSIFMQQLHRHMNQLCQTPATQHTSPATFIHDNLKDSKHFFLQQDTIRRDLEPPYSGSHTVLPHTYKTLKIVMHGQVITVSGDRIKPAYLLEDNLRDTGNPPHQPSRDLGKPDAAPSLPPRTTHSERTVCLPLRFST